MPRKRSISPGFFKSDELAKLPPLTRIFYAGLWCWADRNGVLEDRPMRLKGEIMPFDSCDGEKMMSDLADGGHIKRYDRDGERYALVVKFKKHQPNIHPKEQAAFPLPIDYKPPAFDGCTEKDPAADGQHIASEQPASHRLEPHAEGSSRAYTSSTSLPSCTSLSPREARPKKNLTARKAAIAASLPPE